VRAVHLGASKKPGVIMGTIEHGGQGWQYIPMRPPCLRGAPKQYPDKAAALQAQWWIDPQNSTGKASDSNDGASPLTPLLSDRERAARVGGQAISQQMTVTLLSALQPDDYITEPLTGLSGFFLVTGSAGATPLHSGTLTGAAAQSGNAPPTVADAGVNWSAGGPGASSLIGYRLRVTSGPRQGAVCWLVHDSGTGVAVVSDPEILTTLPTQFTPTSVNLAAGDPYVIESLPLVPIIVSPYGCGAAGEDLAGNFVRFMYEGILFPQTAYTTADTRECFQRQFVACNMGAIETSAIYLACIWLAAPGFYLEFSPGFEMVILGCVFVFLPGPGLSGSGLLIAAGASVTLDSGTFSYGAPIIVIGWLGITQYLNGSFTGVSAGVVDSYGAGIVVEPGGLVHARYPLWGSGNAGPGIQVRAGGTVVYETKPTITGAGGDTIVGGSPFTYALIPQFVAANGASLVAYA
jgi:hypothetical protein